MASRPSVQSIERRAVLRKVVREVTTIQHRCCVCGTWFEPERSDAAYCTQVCRSRAYRRRKKVEEVLPQAT